MIIKPTMLCTGKGWLSRMIRIANRLTKGDNMKIKCSACPTMIDVNGADLDRCPPLMCDECDKKIERLLNERVQTSNDR